MAPPTSHELARRIQERWREHRLAVRIARMRELQQRQQEERQRRAAALERKRLDDVEARKLPGAMARVWPVVREVIVVMCASVVLTLIWPPTFRSELPPPFAVRNGEQPMEQARAALAGAAAAVFAFTALFLALTLLYVYRWERTLYTVHSIWIGCLLGGPLLLLLMRAHEAFGVAVDVATLVFAVCNLTAPGVVLVHWSATATRFATARRVYANVTAIVCAWALAGVPYQTAVAALLMLAVLDVLLVSLPGAPVQRLDEIASARRTIGEAQMPGLTFKRQGLELGFGDFLVYSAFAAHAARAGSAPCAAVFVAVAVGLVLTMSRIALARRRTVLPALPLAVAMAATLLALERLTIQPLADTLVVARVLL